MQESSEKEKNKVNNLVHSKKKLDLDGYELVSISKLERPWLDTTDVVYTYRIK